MTNIGGGDREYDKNKGRQKVLTKNNGIQYIGEGDRMQEKKEGMMFFARCLIACICEDMWLEQQGV